MLLIVIRKMLSNKWMTLCTLLGAIITVMVASSIPVYTNGIMQRMLTRDLELSQEDSGKFPGGYEISCNPYYSQDNNNETYVWAEDKIEKIIFPSVKLPVLNKTRCINTSPFSFIRQDNDEDLSASFVAFSEIQDHVKILNGKMASSIKSDGAYEVMATQEAMKVLDLVLGNTYVFFNGSGPWDAEEEIDPSETFKVKVVGIFSYKDLNDPYWFNSLGQYGESLFMDMKLFSGDFTKNEKIIPQNEKWFAAFDYHKITIENLKALTRTFDIHIAEFFDMYGSTFNYNIPMLKIIKEYFEREKQLKITLLVLQIPILLMLAFYSFMISKMKIDFESTEIAIMKSRGAGSTLVFAAYLAESMVIGLIALIIGPLLGFYLCKILGSSNGFLEFVQRSALPLAINHKTYIYSLLSVVFISAAMLIPAAKASRTSIVLYKRKKARKSNRAFWEKYFIDFVLVLLACYGLYQYGKNQKIVFITGLKGTELSIDPLLFVISTMFILGCGLLILRVFPYLINLIFLIGRKKWNPVFYTSFIQIGRTAGQEQFVMLFIILTLSIGIFNACSARTINKNTEDKLRYEIGSDIVVQGLWSSNIPTPGPVPMEEGMEVTVDKSDIHYFEPPFELYKTISGIESVTKVFKQEDAYVSLNDGNLSNILLMGIIPDEFGETAWFRNDLLYPYHWYQYLNLMTDSPKALLVSDAFREKNGAQEGDVIRISWGDMSIEGIIYAFIDYWPSLNPNRKIDNEVNPYFVVANLNYIQAMNIVEPYQVWIKKKPAALSNDIYRAMEEKDMELVYRKDAAEELVKKKNDPLLQGTNGSLTLDFIITVVISIIGFLIYWILSIKKRVLQFGIFRAMGLSFRKIIGMLVLEQLLITGTSIAIGISIGNLASKIFIPMFQMVYGADEQVPPFSVISNPEDYLRLYVFVAIMLIAGLVILRRIILKINVSQVLKLGED